MCWSQWCHFTHLDIWKGRQGFIIAGPKKRRCWNAFWLENNLWIMVRPAGAMAVLGLASMVVERPTDTVECEKAPSCAGVAVPCDCGDACNNGCVVGCCLKAPRRHARRAVPNLRPETTVDAFLEALQVQMTRCRTRCFAVALRPSVPTLQAPRA